MMPQTVLLLSSLVLAVAASAAAAQSYPSKPVRIIVPFTAGGLTDVFTRGLAQELTKLWGQQVIVENRPGANTIIAAEATVKSAPDGYTMLMANDPTLSSNQYLYTKLPYDPVRDLAPVVNLIAVPSVLVANPSLPASTLQELIALAKQKPGEITYGTFGLGSKTHIDTEGFSALAGIKLNHVPYKGIADVVPALIGGQIQIALAGVQPVLPHLRSGKLKAIAMADSQRSPVLPEVPTFAEGGVPGFESRSWFGLVVPAGTPRPVIDRIATDVGRVISTADFRDRFITGVGLEPMLLMTDQFAEFLKADRAIYAARVKNISVKLD
jgi:tripartite-type tricarboxylate transporter receptor subunit TctC